MTNVRVENMINDNGRAIPNQFVIYDDNKIFFQSYKSVIVEISDNQVFLDPDYYDYSVTTSKYRNKFLGITTKELKEKIKTGEFKFKKLN